MQIRSLSMCRKLSWEFLNIKDRKKLDSEVKIKLNEK